MDDATSSMRRAAEQRRRRLLLGALQRCRKDRWRDVALRVLHDPSEGENVDRMMRGMKASLEYYTAQFGPYPDSLLQVIEIPRYSVFGVALPLVDGVLGRRVSQPSAGRRDRPAVLWDGARDGASLVGRHGAGRAGQGPRSALGVAGELQRDDGHGEDLRPETSRAGSTDFKWIGTSAVAAKPSREVPLVDVEDQSYLAYRKGAVAMYTLRDQIGEEAVNSALRSIRGQVPPRGPPYATSLDLIAELRAVMPDSMKSLVTDLFETVTLWEIKANGATVERMADGKYQVTLDVQARKVRADRAGKQTEIPMNDLIEIGVFGDGQERRARRAALPASASASRAASRRFASWCRKRRRAPGSIRTTRFSIGNAATTCAS